MPQSRQVQLNVRSAYARARAHELARLTGMTATQVVEEALRGFVPPGAGLEPPGLVRRGAILVRDPDALKLHACLCNEAVKTHFEEVLRGVYPDPAKDN